MLRTTLLVFFLLIGSDCPQQYADHSFYVLPTTVMQKMSNVKSMESTWRCGKISSKLDYAVVAKEIAKGNLKVVLPSLCYTWGFHGAKEVK